MPDGPKRLRIGALLLLGVFSAVGAAAEVVDFSGSLVPGQRSVGGASLALADPPQRSSALFGATRVEWNRDLVSLEYGCGDALSVGAADLDIAVLEGAAVFVDFVDDPRHPDAGGHSFHTPPEVAGSVALGASASVSFSQLRTKSSRQTSVGQLHLLARVQVDADGNGSTESEVQLPVNVRVESAPAPLEGVQGPIDWGSGQWASDGTCGEVCAGRAAVAPCDGGCAGTTCRSFDFGQASVLDALDASAAAPGTLTLTSKDGAGFALEQRVAAIDPASCGSVATGWLLPAATVELCFDGGAPLVVDDLAFSTPVCGNGVREGLEACDGSDAALCRAGCDGSCDCAGAPAKIAAAGDSITQGFAANCSGGIFAVFCLLAGDKPEFSWFDSTDGSSLPVSGLEQYRAIDPAITSQRASVTGAEMLGVEAGEPNFEMQAMSIVAQMPPPDHVAVLLGGNDLCSRDCIDPANCSDPVYDDAQWEQAVEAGLDVLVDQLPLGSTVVLLGVPRVQDLRDVGLAKSGTNCDSQWSTFNVCRVATDGGTLNGESFAVREAGVAERQQSYNELLEQIAADYDTNAFGENPRGIEVLSDYDGELSEGGSPSVGTTEFTPDDINGADCFHPNLQGQDLISGTYFDFNPDQ